MNRTKIIFSTLVAATAFVTGCGTAGFVSGLADAARNPTPVEVETVMKVCRPDDGGDVIVSTADSQFAHRCYTVARHGAEKIEAGETLQIRETGDPVKIGDATCRVLVRWDDEKANGNLAVGIVKNNQAELLVKLLAEYPKYANILYQGESMPPELFGAYRDLKKYLEFFEARGFNFDIDE